ncbi:calcium/sodium antiporter [Celerinatantimonas diazotrophica]|uniref:Cation:H+ antiporter n=1 Tax=Celerinatantimonas diazotrophica TaxID=412034 RepID=A0A4R1KEU1_9GAMM|nr:calcium/sodium antiporter [Celerinatantimonas diazotrophica]TCK63228.1 cation:H+ antiporter [Celerinatantimonas diazotrophica]CAG9295597.1 Inner membrane protein YrbG [Celerinatantimonas diazotrophica]
MWIDIIVLITSFACLVYSADRFVFGAAALARNLGISPMIIGLTIVAMGSSAPEIMVSATASLNGQLNTAIGNAIGSNITNITLVLGVTALMHPILVGKSSLRREIPAMLFATAITGYLLSDNDLSFFDGCTLFGLFFLMMGYLIWRLQKQHNQLQPSNAANKSEEDQLIEQYEADIPDQVPMTRAIFWLIVGLVILPISSDFLVDSASNIARHLGISELVIGLTIIAVGTSLPELAACVISVIKKENDIALGNIIGSNIFNLLVVLAICGVLAPGKVDPAAFARDYWWMLATSASIGLLSLLVKPHRLTRWAGGLLLITFISYQLVLFL